MSNTDANRTRIARTIEIFEAARRPIFTALDGIAQADFDWNPAPGTRGIGKICRHMYRVDVWFLKRLGIQPVITHDGPDSVGEVAERMRTIQDQIMTEVEGCESDAVLMAERTSLDGEEHRARLGPVVVHIAQHYLYHLAQITYLRRIRDRDWSAPLDEWEAATHLIEDLLLE